MPTARSYRAIPHYYDPENAHLAILQQDVPLFLRQLPRKKQQILEIAVGTGRAAIPLAQAGHRVVGIDYDPKVLEIARHKRDSVGLSDRNLSLHHLNALKLNLSEKFDWICIFFNTFLGFTELEEQDQLLKVVRRHLKPRGKFWLDIFYPYFDILAHKHQTGIDPITFYVPEFDRAVMRTVEIRRDEKPQVQHITSHYRWFDSRGRLHRERNDFDLTYMLPRELKLLLERNGLRIEKFWGNYDQSPVTGNSPRMIARCCRAG